MYFKIKVETKMRSFSTIYKEQKQNRMAEINESYRQQKIEICKALKQNYMIESRVKDMSPADKARLSKKILEYWSPISGINSNGVALLNENKLALDKSSSKKDISRYIINETKKNYQLVISAFKNNTSKELVESMKEDIKEKTGRVINESSIRDIMWNLVADKIKIGG